MRVGILACRGRRLSFEYHRTFLDSAIQLSPYYLPLKSGKFCLKEDIFDGLFGLFNDSLPDGWGHLLLKRLLQVRGQSIQALSPLDRLALVGSHGMGALEYEPDRSGTGTDSPAPQDLDRLAEACARILEEKDCSLDSLEQLSQASGYACRARPKVMLALPG